MARDAAWAQVIVTIDDGVAWPAVSELTAASAVRAVLEAERGGNPWLDFDRVEAGVRLSNDVEVRDFNRRWRGKDAPTNVLSFAMNDGEEVPGPELGDLILALETITREAAEQGKSLEDRLTHLAVHGTLHLLGYDHEISEAEARRMEAREIDILAGLEIANPYE